MGNRGQRGICVAGTVLIQKVEDPHRAGLQSLSCTGCVPDVTVMLKQHTPSLPVSAVGAVGADAEGRYIVQSLQSAGISVQSVCTVEGEVTGFRDQAKHKGAVCKFGVENVIFRHFSCDIFHLGHLLKLEKVDSGHGQRILKHARNCGMQISISVFGGNSQRYGTVLAALPYADYLIVNLEDGAKLANIDPDEKNMEKIGRWLLSHGVKQKVFIQGQFWLACCTRTKFSLLGNCILPQVAQCSTEQALDGFCAGVLTGISKNWNDLKILEFASSCAAVKQCGKVGITSIPQIDEFGKTLLRSKKVL